MEETNFEETMEELGKITMELEKGDLNLDDPVKKFEKGMELSKNANKILEEAEKRITILIENNGEIQEENFNTDSLK